MTASPFGFACLTFALLASVLVNFMAIRLLRRMLNHLMAVTDIMTELLTATQEIMGEKPDEPDASA